MSASANPVPSPSSSAITRRCSSARWRSPAWISDEFHIAGGMLQRPLQLVKCKTIPLEVPADAEIVLECETRPGERRPEAPFGEYPGTYGPRRDNPVLEIKAITRRNAPLYQNAFVGHSDNLLLSGLMAHRLHRGRGQDRLSDGEGGRGSALRALPVRVLYRRRDHDRGRGQAGRDGRVRRRSVSQVRGGGRPRRRSRQRRRRDACHRHPGPRRPRHLHGALRQGVAARSGFLRPGGGSHLVTKVGIDATRKEDYPPEISVPGADALDLADYIPGYEPPKTSI